MWGPPESTAVSPLSEAASQRQHTHTHTHTHISAYTLYLHYQVDCCIYPPAGGIFSTYKQKQAPASRLSASWVKQLCFKGEGGEGLSFPTNGGTPSQLGGGRLWGGSELTGTAPLFGQSTCTNHRNRGRTSTDRSTKATLMLTVPRSIIKSSTKDLT